MNITPFWQRHFKFAGLAGLVWVAHFFHFRAFGLYEDDFAHLNPAINWGAGVSVYVRQVFFAWPNGRPLNFLLPLMFSSIGTHLGGLPANYLIAFSIITLNVCLFYLLLRKIGSETVAITGALAFCLFPADTTHILLVHAFHLQTSLTFLLLASLCYLSGRRLLSYLIIPWSLLSYESPFMVFFAVPLLVNRWNRALTKELSRHIIILTGIILLVAGLRLLAGEARITELGGGTVNYIKLFAKMGAGIMVGPAVSLILFLYGPLCTLLRWNWQLSVVFTAGLAGFIWLLRQLDTGMGTEKSQHQISFHSKFFTYHLNLQTFRNYTQTAKICVTGLLMLCLAYALSFTHFPPIARFGRMTSVHLAAAFGGSLIFACVCSTALSIADLYQRKSRAILVIAVYLSLVLAYRFSIQLDFKQAWQTQRTFWTEVVNQAQDITDETVILVTGRNLPRKRYVMINSWVDPLILGQLFQFPSQWKKPPRLFVVYQDWSELITYDDDGFKWAAPTVTSGTSLETLPNSNVILLEPENGQLVRRFGAINIKGKILELKPRPVAAKLNFERKPLYSYLINDNINDNAGK